MMHNDFFNCCGLKPSISVKKKLFFDEYCLIPQNSTKLAGKFSEMESNIRLGSKFKLLKLQVLISKCTIYFLTVQVFSHVCDQSLHLLMSLS